MLSGNTVGGKREKGGFTVKIGLKTPTLLQGFFFDAEKVLYIHGVGTIDPFKSICHLGKNRNRSNRFFVIFFSEIKLDSGKRLKRTVKIYSLLGAVESSK